MKKEELAGRLAKRSHVTKAAAADKLDGMVSQILRKLRRGEPASLPGLGTFTPGDKPDFHFETRKTQRRGRRGDDQ